MNPSLRVMFPTTFVNIDDIDLMFYICREHLLTTTVPGILIVAQCSSLGCTP